jgi:iron complex outermembrane recepter protein
MKFPCFSLVVVAAFFSVLSVSAADNDTLDTLLVTGESAPYLSPIIRSGSKLEIEPRYQVQTINTVTAQELQDRGITGLGQAVETITGVRPIAGVYSSQDVTGGIRSRGFENRFSFINGLRFQSFGFPIETQTIDTLEVLKGPGGVLFGQGDPGGTLNIITKRPRPSPFTELEMTYGSHDFYRATLDTNGVLFSRPTYSSSVPSDGKGSKEIQSDTSGHEPVLLYRLNTAYQNNDTYRDFVEVERYMVAPSLTWNMTHETTLHVDFSYLHEDYRFDRGLPPQPITLTLPEGRFGGEPDMPLSYSETYSIFWNLEHRINEEWKLVQRAGFMHQFGRQYEISAFDPVNGNGNDGLFSRNAYSAYSDNTYYLIQQEIHGAFTTGAWKHKSVLGAEYSYSEFGYGFRQYPTIGNINLRNPVYGTFSFDSPSVLNGDPEAYGDAAWAAYLDHQIEFLPNLRLALGARFDWSDGYYKNLATDKNYNTVESTGFSPRIGAVWSPIESMDLYASYAQTFAPNLFSDGAGKTFDPEEGEAYEIGFRQRFYNGRLQLSGALYQITKENILNPDPTDPTGLRQILNGEERSRGFELEMKGEILPGWSVSAGYSYLEAEVTESNTDPIGLALVDAPENSFNFFTRYEVQNGWAKGFFIGYGVAIVDERRSSFANPTFNLPSYVRHDAVVGYAKNAWRTQLTLENLGNENYYETHGNNIFPQDGLNVKASVSYKF